MMLAGDLPWLWCGAVPVRMAAADHRTVDPEPAALAAALAGCAASTPAACLVVPPQVTPWPVATALSPTPDLVRAASAAGRALLWPAVNDLTGGPAASTGLWLVTAALIRALPADRTLALAARILSADGTAGGADPVVPPQYAATWLCGATPELAFRAGHAALTAQGPEDPALTAALGADRPHGLWWGIGAAHALLGTPAEAAWQAEAALLDAPEPALAARRAELARAVRVRRGLALHPLDAATAAAVRAMRTDLPPAALWDRHADDLSDLTGAGSDDVTGHRFARSLLWGTAPPVPG